MENVVRTLELLKKSSEPNIALDSLQQIHIYLTKSAIDYTKFEQFTTAAFPSDDKDGDPEPHGLLNFLYCHIGEKQYDKAKIEALRIIQWLLDSDNNTIRDLMWNLCIRFKRIATLIWKNPRESSNTQQDALECIILILENFRDLVSKQNEFELATLYGELLPSSEKSMYSATVRGKMFHCLGIVATFGVNTFLQTQAKYLQLWNHFIYTIKCQVDSVNQHLEANILQGCINGLSKFLQAYHAKIPKDDPNLKILYEKLEQIIDPKCSIENDSQTFKLKRREFQRTGLEFVSNYSSFLSEILFTNHEQWFRDLMSWAKSNNADDSKVGMRAMIKFLESTCEYLYKLQLKKDKEDDVNEKGILHFKKFFTETFKTILDIKGASKNERTIAVKGAGLLATVFEDPGIVEELFSKMIRIIEDVIVELNMPIIDKYSGTHALLPTYLESAGNILLAVKLPGVDSISHQSTISQSRISTFQRRLTVVENLSILLTTSYPDLSEKYRYFAPISFFKVIQGLHTGHQDYCEVFLERVIHEGMTHIIASPTQVEADILTESYSSHNQQIMNSNNSFKSIHNRLGIRTVKFYTPFWVGLIKINAGSQNMHMKSMSVNNSDFVLKLIYDGILQWVFKTIGKLDLSLEFVDDENDDGDTVNLADPIYNTKAAVVKDFQLFVNIVDFLTEFLLQTDVKYFSCWVDVLLNKVFKYIQKHSLVSGFYRIMGLVFEMSRRLNYFESLNAETDKLLMRCCGFLHELSKKIPEFRDDLLLAVLEVWLSAPNQMILHSCTSLRDTLLCVFRTGKNWLPLAQKGIEALERWFQISEFPEDEMETLFNKLFPVLQTYFTATELAEDEVNSFEGATTKQDGKIKNISASAAKSRRNRNRAGSKDSQQRRLLQAIGTELQDTTLGKLQLNILNFIGSYGHLLDVDNECDPIGFSVDGKCLKYVMPFQDIKPDLYLDDFIPRLLKLCSNSTDRQLRSSACEVFHSFTLYFLGHSVSNHSPTDLFRRIFSTVLELGCDSDIVIRQLFNPLGVQIIHWCTSENNPFAEFTLNIVIDGLIQSEEPSKRDFSGVCLQEYFQWCLKHSNYKQGKQVLKFLISLSQHASSQYRQGSVLGFNSIYKTFRENSELVNEYTFQLLHSYVTCLDLYQQPQNDVEFEVDPKSMLVRSTMHALQHLERIIIKKKENFNFVVGRRKIPNDLKGGTLLHLVEWLLMKSGNSFSRLCRHHCFRLIRSFCGLIRNISSVEAFIGTFDSSKLLEIAEQSLNFSLWPGDLDVLWSLEVSSDVYAFLKKSNFTSVEFLLRMPESKLSRMLESFLKKFKIEVNKSVISGGVRKDRVLQDVEMDTEDNEENLFDFDFESHNILLQDLGSKDCIRALNIFCNLGTLENIFPPEIQAQVIVLSAMMSVQEFERSVNSGVAASAEAFENGRIIETWMKFWDNLLKDSLSNVTEISKTLKDILKIDLKNGCDEGSELKEISLKRTNWLTIVVKKGFLAQIFNEGEIKDWIYEAFKFIDSQLFERNKSNGILEEKIISSRMQNLLEAVFKLALAILGPDDENNIVEKIFDPLQVQKSKLSTKTTKGEVYQKYFIASVPYSSQLLDFRSLQHKIGMEKLGQFVQKLLITVKNTRKKRLRFGKIIVENTVEIWEQLSLNCTNETIASLISGMASLHMNFCRDSAKLSKWWCGKSMMTCVNLSLQDKSNFIHFFGLFGLSQKEEIVKQVMKTLHDVLAESLNSPLIDWKSDENFVLKILHTILKVFEEIPENLELLKVIALVVFKTSVLSSVDSNSCSSIASKKIEQIVPTVEHWKQQMNMADTVYACITSNENDGYRQSMAVTNYLLLPIVACLGERAAKEFFKKNINDIVKNAGIQPESIVDWHSRITALHLIEMLCLLKSSTLFFTGPELNSIYLKRLGRQPNPQDSKDCAKDIIRVCTGFVSPSEPRNESTRKLVYQSNQAAFNVLHAGLRVMGSPFKSVLGIAVNIPTTISNKEKWLNIIDCSISYNFPILLEAKKQIEEQNNEDIYQPGESSIEPGSSNSTNNIIKALGATNNRALRKSALASSSLAMDATNYDFTSAVTIENSKFYQRLFKPVKTTTGVGGGAAARFTVNSNLEWNHPCMVPFVETLRNFYKNKDDPKNQGNQKPLMEGLIDTLNSLLKKYSQQPHQNVQIFLICSILNCKDIFKFYAKDLKDAVVKSILPPQPCFGPELNYILKDVLVMLLEWQQHESSLGSSYQKLLSSQQVLHLLEFLIPNVSHERKDVFSQHLEILEAIVKTWVTEIDVEKEIPYDKIDELLMQTENRLGLEICKHILLGGQLPCHLNGNKESNSCNLDLVKLFYVVSKTFGSTSKLTYGLGGEVIGLLFRQLENRGCKSELENALKAIQKVLDKERSKTQQLLIILNKIQTFYEPFVSLYKSSVLELLRNENVRADALCLIPGILSFEIKSCVGETSKLSKCLDHFYSDLDGRGVFQNHCKTELEVQAAVSILTEFINSSFKDEHRLITMIEWTERPRGADMWADPKLRISFATAVSTLYYSFGGRREKSSLSMKAHKLFIRLQNDSNEAMKYIVADFWERNLKSWKNSPNLILELMEILGDEKNAITISIELIIKRCGLSPDFSKEIFPKDLGDCVFQKYDLDTSWRNRFSTFQPLYAESLSSSQNFSQFPKSLQLAMMSQRQISGGAGSIGLNVLRATLNNLQFSPTAPGQSSLSMSLSNSQDEPMDGNFDFGGSFNPERFYGSFNYHSESPSEAGIEDPNGGEGQKDQGSQNVLGRLRKRFYDRPASQSSSNFFARRTLEKQEAQVERKVEAIRSKRSGVKLIRSYRIGELPDIMMKNSDLLATVSAMIKNDDETGRNFLVHLFTSIFKEIQERDPEKANVFQSSAIKSFENIFRKYESSISPEFAAAIIEIALVSGNSFKIQPSLVTGVSRQFGLQKLAILKLEEILELEELTVSSKANENQNQIQNILEPQPKKARLTATDKRGEDCTTVLPLTAQLYKDLEDFDAVRIVFLMASKKASNEELSNLYKKGCDALKCEGQGKFEEAFQLYDELYQCEDQLDPDVDDCFSEERLGLWDESAFTCLKQLSKWDKVYERAEQYVEKKYGGFDYNRLFADNEYITFIMPHQLTSATQILIRGQGEEDEDDDQDQAEASQTARLYEFIEQLRMRGSILADLIGEYMDLAILSIHCNNENEISHIPSWLDKIASMSLKNFHNFTKMSKLRQKEQILSLQRVSIVKDYLTCYKTCRTVSGPHNKAENITNGVQQITLKWKHCGKPKTSSLFNAEMIVTEKNYFWTEIGTYAQQYLEEFDKSSLYNEMKIANYNQHLWLADLSIVNHNHTVAWDTFRKTKEVSHDLEEKWMVEYKKLVSQYLIAFTEDDERWEDHWVNVWKSLRKLEAEESLQASFWEVKTNLLTSIFTKLSLGPLEDDRKIRKQLRIDSSTNLVKHISSLATDLAKDVQQSSESETYSTSNTAKGKKAVGGNIHMRLYHLLKEIKRKCEKGLSTEEITCLNSYMLTCLLKAMINEEMESLRLFPTSFSILEKYPQLLPTFEEMVVGIPSWMFLPWLDQIVTNYKNNNALKQALNPIIERLIADFPQAFQLQYTDLLLKKNKISNVYALYSQALTAVTVPSRLMKEYLPNPENLANMDLKSCLDRLKQKLEEFRDEPNIYGDLHQTYINNMLPKVDLQVKRLDDSNGSQDFDSNSQNMEGTGLRTNLFKSVIKDIRTASDKCDPKEVQAATSNVNIRLERFSPWLARFRLSQFKEYLEVPGLYNKFELPNSNFHPKIVSFHPTALLLHSLTKPVRITLLCNNGKEVKVLVKKGDDLRQDKRIQQCFRVANEIFKGDSHCRERRLQILTYNVIPITNDFGLIEWIDKTVSLKRLILNSKNLEKTYGDQCGTYRKWMGSFSPEKFKTSLTYPYHINAQFCGRANAEKKFDECRNLMPRGLLREHIIAGCNSHHDYFTLREKIIRSYATMCLVHWLLGIGDRHLENSLISTETGEFLGIDFGRSFGIAIFMQDIPELIPFRLTPQIQDFLQPYGFNGIFKETMLHAQRAMKKSADLLTAVADVFIKEPLTDWLKIRGRNRSNNDQEALVKGEEEDNDKMETESTPKNTDNLDRIKILTWKLLGKNPVNIIAQDIQKLKPQLRPIYINIIKDGKGELGIQQKLTDEEYVDILIALASDKNILARLYEGWSPWL